MTGGDLRNFLMYHFLMNSRSLPYICILSLLLVTSAAGASPDFSDARREMIERDIKGRGIEDEKVLTAMGTIPRERFVPDFYRSGAYADNPLPIGEGQTISQPYVVALMTEALDLKPSDRVLEIGTGSGYQAAVLAEIVDEVYTIEIRKRLARRSEDLLRELGYMNLHVRHADGYFGWKEHAPFDAIIITAAVNHIPPPLLRQLKDGGRLIVPLGSTTFYQTLTIVTKKGEDFRIKQMEPVRFVPMTGEAMKRNRMR
jgi:protein-L-isoaspartate(D-aspartate) O-methyltransferase